VIHDEFPGVALHNVAETTTAPWNPDGHRLRRTLPPSGVRSTSTPASGWAIRRTANSDSSRDRRGDSQSNGLGAGENCAPSVLGRFPGRGARGVRSCPEDHRTVCPRADQGNSTTGSRRARSTRTSVACASMPGNQSPSTMSRARAAHRRTTNSRTTVTSPTGRPSRRAQPPPPLTSRTSRGSRAAWASTRSISEPRGRPSANRRWPSTSGTATTGTWRRSRYR